MRRQLYADAFCTQFKDKQIIMPEKMPVGLWTSSLPVFVAKELIPISQVLPIPVSVAKGQTIKKTKIEVFIWLCYRIVVNSNVEIV